MSHRPEVAIEELAVQRKNGKNGLRWSLVAGLLAVAAAAFSPWWSRAADETTPGEAPPTDLPPGEAPPTDLPPGEETAESGADERPPYETVAVRGRVVWLAEALERRYGIVSDADSARANVALETPAGELHLLIKDARGRAFTIDPRLMEMDLELVLRRFHGAPASQVVKIFAWEDDGKYEFDYWCDICAIPMYERKPCECCQGETRIRLRPVADDAR